MRSVLFVSHANPEDNTPTLWLAPRLAAEGYRVWSDLTNLLGGEDFWRDIEKILRQEAVKFLYVLTNTSNAKDGPLAELHLAKKIASAERLRDFVIPLVFDDIRSGDFNIELTRLNAISFFPSWADGLTQLMRKLDSEQVLRDMSVGREASREWWRLQSHAISRDSEVYLSNWFPINELPKIMYIHQLKRRGTGLITVPTVLPYPAIKQAASLVSFAPRPDLENALGPEIAILDSRAIDLDQLDSLADSVERKRLQDLLSSLLRAVWESRIGSRLPLHEMSGGFSCFYFPHLRDADYLRARGGQKGSRQLAGMKTITAADRSKHIRYWHFGIDGRTRLSPVPASSSFRTSSSRTMDRHRG